MKRMLLIASLTLVSIVSKCQKSHDIIIGTDELVNIGYAKETINYISPNADSNSRIMPLRTGLTLYRKDDSIIAYKYVDSLLVIKDTIEYSTLIKTLTK